MFTIRNIVKDYLNHITPYMATEEKSKIIFFLSPVFGKEIMELGYYTQTHRQANTNTYSHILSHIHTHSHTQVHISTPSL